MSRKSSPSTASAEPRALAAGLARRAFLRACAVTGVGLAAGFPPPFAQAVGASPDRGKIVVGLEIGSSKICAVVAERLPDGTSKILGVAQAPSCGIGRWGIFDHEAAADGVRAVLADAEAQADVMIRRVALAVMGARITAFPRAWDQHSDDYKLAEFYSAKWSHGSLLDPDMADDPASARRMGVTLRMQNNLRCLRTLGVTVESLAPASVASAEAVRDAAAKKRGALVIDLGDSTTDYAVYAGGVLRQSASVHFGSRDLREEFARQLRLPFASGEKLLIAEGSVRLGQSPPGTLIVVHAGPGSIPREIDRKMLNTIVHRKVREAFKSVKCDIQSNGLRLDSLRAGVHLTGGCSLLLGIGELAEEVFGIPASPARVTGICTAASILENARLSCALGLASACL